MRSTNGKLQLALKKALREKQHETFFKLLYRHFNRLVLSVIKARFVPYDRTTEPEDILCEVFYKLCRRGLRPYTEVRLPTIRNYIYTVTVNCINSYIRKAETSGLSPLPKSEIPPTIGIVDAKIRAFEFEDRLTAYLQQLTPTQREVFRLKLIEGYPYNEIADALNITNSNARQFLSQARKKLKALLMKDAGII